LDNSSRLFPLVSGINKVVKMPVSMKKAKSSRLVVNGYQILLPQGMGKKKRTYA
jgi:hypothetical protein